MSQQAEVKKVVTFHELMKPYLVNLIQYLRKVLAEENAPEEISILFMTQFNTLYESAKDFENFVEHILTNFWKKKENHRWQLGAQPSDEYYVDFDAMEAAKKDSKTLLGTAYQLRQITLEQYEIGVALLAYEMKPENKEKFRRYLSMFCEVRHNSNSLLKKIN